MRLPLIAVLTLLLGAACAPADEDASPTRPEPSAEAHALDGTTYTDAAVDAACGQCQFDLGKGGCDLALRIEGVALFVDGTGIDDHGDSHADDGFCNAVLGAEVSGRVEGGVFIATSMQLVASEGEG